MIPARVEQRGDFKRCRMLTRVWRQRPEAALHSRSDPNSKRPTVNCARLWPGS
jgi:hypothetical protein